MRGLSLQRTLIQTRLTWEAYVLSRNAPKISTGISPMDGVWCLWMASFVLWALLRWLREHLCPLICTSKVSELMNWLLFRLVSYTLCLQNVPSCCLFPCRLSSHKVDVFSHHGIHQSYGAWSLDALRKLGSQCLEIIQGTLHVHYIHDDAWLLPTKTRIYKFLLRGDGL